MPTAAPEGSPGYRPGFLDAMGTAMGQSVANWNAGWNAGVDAAIGAFGGLGMSASKSALDAAKGMNDAAKGAGDAAAKSVGSLGAARVVPGRERCSIAPNGGPDCANAAQTLCKTRGYATGRSVDFETSEKCPGPTLVAGRVVAGGACTTEHFVIRAFCQ